MYPAVRGRRSNSSTTLHTVGVSYFRKSLRISAETLVSMAASILFLQQMNSAAQPQPMQPMQPMGEPSYTLSTGFAGGEGRVRGDFFQPRAESPSPYPLPRKAGGEGKNSGPL